MPFWHIESPYKANKIMTEDYQNQNEINERSQRKIKINEQTLRIIRIMEEEKMNATQFAETIGIQRAAMSHLINGRNNPSADVITRIVERFDTINPRWLLSGKGSMRIGRINESDPDGGYSSGINERKDKTNYGNEPDLFNQLNTPRTSSSGYSAPAEENIRTEIRFMDERSEGKEDNIPDNINKAIEKEVIIYKERPIKTINKLLIFYSDNTYETFIPEKHLKDEERE